MSHLARNDEDNGDSVFRGWVGLRTQVVVGTNMAVHIKLVTPELVRFPNCKCPTFLNHIMPYGKNQCQFEEKESVYLCC